MWSNRWKKGVDYPEWAESDVYKKTIQEIGRASCRERV